MEITKELKQKVTEALKAYVARYPSQNKAAQSLKGISAATLSTILKGTWDVIGDDMWLNLIPQLGMSREWRLADTLARRGLNAYFEDGREDANVIWITGPAGIGKSTAAREYEQTHRNVFLLPCSEDMHKSDFIRELAAVIGVKAFGLTIRETLQSIIKELARQDRPLLIFDEGDKLTDSVLYYYVSLYNALEDKCGMVFLSTNYMTRRMSRGVESGKKGYDELESRICRRFVPLDLVNSTEVEGICQVNGLSDRTAIKTVLEEAHECGNDLRRVRKSVHKELRKLAVQAATGNN